MSMVYCRGCGKEIHESAPTCPHCGAPQKAPSAGKDIPDGVRGWSWGAFLLSWIWAIGNKTWIGLLALIPYVGLIMAIVLGIKGREWAWKNKEWASLEEFNRIQRQWSKWAVIIVFGIGGIGILAAIAIPQYAAYKHRAQEAQLMLERKQEEARQVEAQAKREAELQAKMQAQMEAEQARISPANQSAVAQAKAAEPESKDVLDAATCGEVTACVRAMLASAKVENLSAAMEAARRIDSFTKPERGDRKAARKLNDQGLDAFKQGNKTEAVTLLTRAQQTDPLDEEILSNLVYVTSESGEYSRALTLATNGFILNPRRASLWMPYSQAKAKLGNQPEALQAMWLAWQFSTNKEKMLNLLDKKIAEEQSDSLKPYYVAGKAWLVDNRKPSF